MLKLLLLSLNKLINQKEKKAFIWDDSSPKIKHKLYQSMDFKALGFKNIYIWLTFVSLQCSWVKKLYDNCFHEWKIVLLHLLAQYFDFTLNFTVIFKDNTMKNVPSLYKQMLMNWKKKKKLYPVTPSCILSRFCGMPAMEILFETNVRKY